MSRASAATLEAIADRVERIRAVADDDYEAAHGYEDDLFRDVLEAIAKGASDPRKLARAALKSTVIEFPRVCA